MDARELKAIIDGVADTLPDALLKNNGVETLANAICRIASYLESEQDKRIKLAQEIERHQKMMADFDKIIWGDKTDLENKPGIAYEFAANRKQSKRNEKLIIGVLTGIGIAIALMLLQMMGVKIK